MELVMNCPVCGKEARVHIYYGAKYAVYVHTDYWQKHVLQAHKK